MNNLKRVTAIAVFLLIVAIVVSILTAAIPAEYEAIDIAEVVTTEEAVETQPETIVLEVEEPEEVAKYTRFAKCQVNLRATPSMEGDPVAVLPRGTGVAIFPGAGSGWYEVEYLGNRYYAWNEYLVDAETWAELSEVPFSEQVPLSEDLQKYLWEECQDTNCDYCFVLAIMDIETGGTFNPNIISKTADYGLMQCNQCWKSTFKKLGFIQESMKELLNPYNSIHAGVYLLSQYVHEFGPTEPAAVKYNRGNATSKSSTPYSRKAMANYAKWKAIVFPEQTTTE